ncbi:maleylpyruvate isomerase N-terminal domain-containing protein [Streptomyces sp. NPDC086077]|uniref:maleylpyruvate isomerase N-terminal domain-containing protein n=1 Tax=Streptomyces sp. NPDC086077 TaxID=3154862 RepID=UPI0034423C11
MDLFSPSWSALRAAVAELADEDFARPSGCAGWLVRDLVCHLVIDAQDVLITLATPTEAPPTRDAVTYWEVAGTPPTGDDPLDALIVRLAAAYQEPWLLKFHLDDVGSAAGRAAGLADPGLRVSTRDQVLTAGDYLSAYVLEWTLHHLDLIAHLPHLAEPPAEGLARSRAMLEEIAGGAFPASFSDKDALLVGTGRRGPTGPEAAQLGAAGAGGPGAAGGLAARLPLALG